MKEDKVEIWEKFLRDYPVIDESDKFGLAAKARLSELKPTSGENDENVKSLEDESPMTKTNNVLQESKKIDYFYYMCIFLHCSFTEKESCF
jgi:hypothetical protein